MKSKKEKNEKVQSNYSVIQTVDQNCFSMKIIINFLPPFFSNRKIEDIEKGA